jgi:archaemetzincin
MIESRQPRGRTPIVAVIPFENAPITAANVIAAHVSGYLDLAAETLNPMEIPSGTLDEGRLQYDAGTLIAAIEAMPLHDYFKIIALFDVDLFIPLLTHVFGEARQNGRVALVSLYRLVDRVAGSSPSTGRVLERVAKTALHEMGHLLNLLHCDDERCLMHFTGQMETLDRTNFTFCRYCRRALKLALAHTEA